VEETNLARNIFMLRKALGESPPESRYIVTVPGRGYRLAEDAHLLEAPDQDVSIVAANRSRVQLQVNESKPWAWMNAVGILLIALAAALFRFSLRGSGSE
jgi:eukaryotic-like serine/threonine-protein kinase